MGTARNRHVRSHVESDMLNCLRPFAMRSSTITHPAGRNGEIPKSRTNNHPKFSQMISSTHRNSCRDRCAQCCQQCSFLGSGVPALSCHGWSVIVDRCWSWVNLFLLIFQRWERDLGIPHRRWPTGGRPPCGWARANSQTNILSEQMKEL